MNSFNFRASSGPILVNASASGPNESMDLRLILDTGATTSLIDRDVLIYLGFDPDEAAHRVEVTTGSAVESWPLVTLNRLTALGTHRLGFPVIAHSLPRVGSGIVGLLGLDFLRGHRLEIDFIAGVLTFQ